MQGAARLAAGAQGAGPGQPEKMQQNQTLLAWRSCQELWSYALGRKGLSKAVTASFLLNIFFRMSLFFFKCS